jgi:hypothetical protein
MRSYQVRDLGLSRWDIVYHDDINGVERYSPHIYYSYDLAVEIADKLELADVTHPDWDVVYKK